MNLLTLFESLVEQGRIPASRLGPAKTAVKQYAAMLGCPDAGHCPIEKYYLPAPERKQLIEEKARRNTRSSRGVEGLSVRAVTNLKNNISYVLRVASAEGMIPAEPPRPAGSIEPLGMKGTYTKKQHGGFWLYESVRSPTYRLSDEELPSKLRKELDGYAVWSTEPFNPERPRKRVRRQVTVDRDRGILCRYAGFLVNIKGLRKANISFRDLVNPANADAYARWLINQQGRPTRHVENHLISGRGLAQYMELTAKSEKDRKAYGECYRKIVEMHKRLPDLVTVRDKMKRWLSLEQLEMCGLSRYPRNKTKLAEVDPRYRKSIEDLRPIYSRQNFKATALWAMESLALRLMIRIPVRSRCIREMCWNPHRPEEGKNLFRKDGDWYVRFSGPELKVGRRNGRDNEVMHRVPPELTWLVEEVLSVWRPVLTGVPYHFPVGSEAKTWDYAEPTTTKAPKYKNAPQDVHVFLSRAATPLCRGALNMWVKRTTYRYTGVPTNAHLIRDIWATSYIKETGDFIGAAMRLGDTVQIVMKHYAHLFDDDARARGDAFNAKVYNAPAGGGGESSTSDVSELLDLKRRLLAAGISEEEMIRLLKAA